MKKNIISIWGLWVAASVFFAPISCKKTFATNPSHNFVPDDLVGGQGSQTLLNGIYRWMRNARNAEEFGVPSLMILNDLLADDLGASRFGPGWFVYDYAYLETINIQSVRPIQVWSFFYRIVDNANFILEQEDTPAAQRAQALALRAFAYFNLVNYFAHRYVDNKDKPAVPVYLKTTKIPGERETVQNVYNQVVKDLKEAVALFESEEGKKFSAPRKSVIDLSVVYGLLARTYLFMEEWTKAADAADKALSGGKGGHSFDGLDLMSQTEFQSGFNSVANPECMWGLPVNAAQQTTLESFFSNMDPFTGGYAGSSGRIFKFMSKVLYDTMVTTDVRKTLIAKPVKSDALNVVGGDLVQMKFRDPAVSFAAVQSFNSATIEQRAELVSSVPNTWLGENMIMRKAEMYLIYAEACCKSNKNADMKKALKALREKRGVPNGSNNLTIDSVYLERRKELFGEGFRLFDIKRLKLPVDRTRGGHLPAVADALFISAGSDSLNIIYPQREINNNPHINVGDN